MHHTDAPHPTDPRHWTPPLSFSGVGSPSRDTIGPESRHFTQTGGLSAVRCSVKMLQAAETLNQSPEAGGGMMMTMMMMKLLIIM